MHKNGQIYILASLILLFVVFTLINLPNVYEQRNLEKNFEKLSKNYAYESSRLVNSLIASQVTAFDEQFLNFTVQFTSFARTQSPNFGLLYLLTFDTTTHIGNYLDVPVTIQSSVGQSSLEGCYTKIPATIEFQGLRILSGDINMQEISACTTSLVGEDEITIFIEDVPYVFNLSQQGSNLLVLTRQEEGEQRQVFISKK